MALLLAAETRVALLDGWKAFLMGTHPRVGQDSVVRHLPRDLLPDIFEVYMQGYL